MSGSTRIGNLLVKKRKITPQQLFQAIRFQQERRLLESREGKAHTEKSELGEILIELGFISRHQLKTSLSGQRKLRKKVAALAMTFVAPLLTAACGSGASGSGNPSAVANEFSTQSSPATTDTNSSASAVNVSLSSLGDVSRVSFSTSSAASSLPTSSSVLSSAMAKIPGHSSLLSQPKSSFSSASLSSSSVTKSSVSSSIVKSSSSVATSISSSSLSQVGYIDGPVLINWSPPTKRVNGDYLDSAEVGGYELRYKLKSDPEFKSIKINNGYTDSYYFDHLEGNYLFEIATFDTDGLYSDFETIQ